MAWLLTNISPSNVLQNTLLSEKYHQNSRTIFSCTLGMIGLILFVSTATHSSVQPWDRQETQPQRQFILRVPTIVSNFGNFLIITIFMGLGCSMFSENTLMLY